MMTETYEPLIEQSIEIAAPPSAVWALVSDVRRIPEWSPQVDSTRLRHGAEEVALAVEFTNLNRHGELTWKTSAEITRFEPERELAFRVNENWVTWSFTLEPTDGGTRLIQRREAPEGLSDLSIEFADSFMGGHAAYTVELRDGMRQTLEGLRASAEGARTQR